MAFSLRKNDRRKLLCIECCFMDARMERAIEFESVSLKMLVAVRKQRSSFDGLNTNDAFGTHPISIDKVSVCPDLPAEQASRGVANLPIAVFRSNRVKKSTVRQGHQSLSQGKSSLLRQASS